MRAEEYARLKKGDKVNHNRYGNSTVIKHNVIGIIITPDTAEGKAVLKKDSGTEITNYLCISILEVKTYKPATGG